MKRGESRHSQKQRTNKHELRVSARPETLEIRNNADGSRSIAGEAIVYNTLSQDLGGFKERIAPGAFTQSLKNNPDVLAYYSHDPSKILGRVSSGSLAIQDSSTALRFTCKLPDTSWANDVIALASRGDLHSMSFGFSLLPGGDTWEQIGSEIIRTVTAATLYEISVVGDPAYKSSSFSLRSCPASLRLKINRDDDLDDDYRPECDPDSDEYDEDADCPEERDGDCSCECQECEGGSCDQCSDQDCDSTDCISCPEQTRTAHMQLLIRRLK